MSNFRRYRWAGKDDGHISQKRFDDQSLPPYRTRTVLSFICRLHIHGTYLEETDDVGKLFSFLSLFVP